MRVKIESNFFINGVDGESIEIDDTISVKEFLDTISRLSGGRYIFFEKGQTKLDPDDWEVDVNGKPYNGNGTESERLLEDGDTVCIRLLMYSGG